MTLHEAHRAEIGDVLIAAYNTAPFKGGDEVILIEFTGDHHSDMRAKFYHRSDKLIYNGNIMDFRFKEWRE
jgi:hypothetical protein